MNKFWQSVYNSAQSVLKGPKWMSAGIVLNPDVYETYPGDKWKLDKSRFSDQEWEDIICDHLLTEGGYK